jgi:hypothetical protein
MAPFVALVLIRRIDPVPAAALLWSALVVFNPGFGFQYVVWALPFLLMAGHLRSVALVQAGLFIPAALLYWDPWGFSPTGLYVSLMIVVWLGAVVAVVAMGLRLARLTPPAPAGAGPRARST